MNATTTMGEQTMPDYMCVKSRCKIVKKHCSSWCKGRCPEMPHGTQHGQSAAFRVFLLLWGLAIIGLSLYKFFCSTA